MFRSSPLRTYFSRTSLSFSNMHSSSTVLSSSSTDCKDTRADSSTQFSAEWNDNDAVYLHPSRPAKVHRAWERKPHSPFDQQSRFRKVWRRYSFRSQHLLPPDTTISSLSPLEQSPRKVTKKLCLSEGYEGYRGAAARWEKDKPVRLRMFDIHSHSFLIYRKLLTLGR